MTDLLSRSCTVFAGSRRIAAGPFVEVAPQAAQADSSLGPVLVFDDATGAVVDLDLRGSAAEIRARLLEDAGRKATAERQEQHSDRGSDKRTRGRPRLGVVAREVTLLPRHWEWLAAQPGGASQALRRLVEAARRADDGGSRRRASREAAYRFMSAMAGDLAGFEEAARALFAGDPAAFDERISGWPRDVAEHARKLAGDFPGKTAGPASPSPGG